MSKTPNTKNHIAIIGMGCIFPNSRNLKEYWHLLSHGIDAIEEIPEDTHWNLKDYFDQDPSTPDHTYCKRGGFLPKISFDPSVYGIPPNNLEATDTSQLLSLEVARMALEDAGYPPGHPVLEQKKVNVILGVTGTQELVIPLGARLGHPIWKKALEDSGISADKQEEILERIQGDYVPWQENSFPGLLGNVVAGRIANRLNLSGTNTVTDAACASSLSAIHTAVLELITGKCDMSITGGADALNDIFMHMCFSKTGVLSHTSDAKPFSKDADGTVLGEGVGMLVLKRLEDAQKDNNKIYAVIKGIGTSSDGRTSAIYAPDAKGQLKALNQAYQDADIAPSTVGLVEAHGTGTRVGDKVEFDALKQCFSNSRSKNQTALGSVKSMIGHTKAAAGAAGIIKTALSLYNKVIPPTLKATQPDPDLDINNSAFYLNSESKPWVSEGSGPRRSGVSAFGFGGSNFHAVLEEYTPEKDHVAWDGSIQIISFSSNTQQELIEQIKAFDKRVSSATDPHEKKQTIAWQAGESRQRFSGDHELRLLFIHRDTENIHDKLSAAIGTIQGNAPAADIYFSSGTDTGKIGFLFPGQGSQYTGMGKELCTVFPEALQALEAGQIAVKSANPKSDHKPLSQYIFPLPGHVQKKKTSEDQLRSTDVAQPAIGGISLGMLRILKRFGISPDITCGHSYGELCALFSAGWMDENTFLDLSAARGKHMARASQKDGDSGSMLAVRASLKEIEALIKDNSLDLVLANRNSYSQGILSGPTDQIQKAMDICKQNKLTAIQLPVAAAFHSKFVEDAALPFKKDLSEKQLCATPIPVLSNTTGTVYSKKPEEIKHTLGNQLMHPVNFVDNLEDMFRQGVKTFIEVGPKSVLTGLAKSVLKKKNISAISLDASSGKKSGMDDLAKVLCLIASKGHRVDLSGWEDTVSKPVPQKMKIDITGANLKPKNPCTRPKSAPMQQATRVESVIADKTSAPELTTPLKQHTDSSALSNRSNTKGSEMTSSIKQNNKTAATPHSYEAMQMVQKGLEAMQQLQTQTAQAHEKFLDTQAQATKTLASMMDQTRNLVFSSSGQPSAPRVTAPTPEPTPASSYPDVNAKTEQPATIEPVSQAPQKSAAVNSPVEVPLSVDDTKDSADNLVEPILFDIVSKLTGFPVEMLDSDMNIESDLGIDSIKKVEIISELEKQIPACEGLTSDNIGSVRTLKDICLAIQDQSPDTPDASASPEVPQQSSSSGSTQQTVSVVLMDTISELTGFPVEMLEPSMNLESDLGIDSIKRVEILSKLEQQIDHIDTISSDDIANLKTIEEIVAFLTKSETQTETSVQKKTPESEIAPENDPSGEKHETKLSRQIVKLAEYPTNQIRFYNGARIELQKGKTVYITKDRSKIAAQFKKEFEKLGISAKLIELNNQDIPLLEDAAGIVLVPDAFKSDSSKEAMTFIKTAFQFVHKNAQILIDSGEQKSAFLTTVSFLGGGFGFNTTSFKTNPVYGGLSGLAKTASLEWKNVLCRAIDLPDDKDKSIRNAEAAVALMMTHGSVEMGLDDDTCNIPSLMDENIETGQPVHLSKNDVVIITGGAKGVTAACAIELSRKFSPTIVLIGRSPNPCSEPIWCENINEPGVLKKAILENAFKGLSPKPKDIEKEYKQIISNREIQDNISTMQNLGSKVKYVSCDIQDYEKIDTVFKSVRNDFGPISTIIHGAGVLEDRLIVDKHIDQFNRVLDTKIKGMDALLKASSDDLLKYFILFSSVAARSGNQGQCDYSMANEILNKRAITLSYKYPDCKFLSINWGPWEGGMVDPSLKKEFEKRGIDLIPLPAGARQMMIEMGTPKTTHPEVIIGAHLLSGKKSKESKLSRALEIDLSTSCVPALNDHRIDSKAVVPFALLMECHAHAAEKNNPGLLFAGMDNMRLLKGITSNAEPQNIHINLGKCIPCENGFQTQSNITSDKKETGAFIHTNCTVLLKEQLPCPPALSKAAFMELKPYPMTIKQAYDSILFHGNALQKITAINGYSKKGIEVVTQLAPKPDQWFSKNFHSKWVIDPMMLDAAFQAAILWSHEKMGQVCLPSFIANLRLYSSFENLKGNIRILFTVNEETKTRINGYFTFLNEKDIVVASIMGFEAVTDPSLKDKFKNEPIFSKSSILAFAQGNPSEAFGDQYKVFDKERQIARLPRPPYFFMDRVIQTDHPQWEMKPGGWIEAQYDIPVDAWYFSANRTQTIPFAILLEIALQPCGWLAAYAGSALESDDRLYFRNLGGSARLIRQIESSSGTLTMRSRMKEVSKAGGMIIQDFDIEVLSGGMPVYVGTTNFGFFTKKALSNQVGIRDSKLSSYQLSGSASKPFESYIFKNDCPLTPDDTKQDQNNGMPSKALRMIDKIELFSLEDGSYENGYVKAVKLVNPSEWFFDAHFYQDPVCPGSLGVESFLQMLRYFLLKKYDIDPEKYEPQICLEQNHEWIYRGQIIPRNKKIEIYAHIKKATEENNDYTVIADGSLVVDGICIYEMKNFGVQFKLIAPPEKKTTQVINKERQTKN